MSLSLFRPSLPSFVGISKLRCCLKKGPVGCRNLPLTGPHPHLPHGGNWKLNPPTPFGCPNTLTIIRNKIFCLPTPNGRNFLLGGRGEFFWKNPISNWPIISAHIKIDHLQIIDHFFVGSKVLANCVFYMH